MSDIFLSYAREDRGRASVLARALEGVGWSVWWDRVIPTGRVFDEVIEEELEAARCVVVLWSSTSVASRWVKAEAESAVEQGKLFPVLVEPVAIPLAFRQFQAADLVAWDGTSAGDGFRSLVTDLSRQLGQPPTSRRSGAAGQRRRPEPRRAATGSRVAAGDTRPRGSGRALLRLGGILLVLVAVVLLVLVWAQGLSPGQTPVPPGPPAPAELALVRLSRPEAEGGERLTGWIELHEPAAEPCDVRLEIHDEAYRREFGRSTPEPLVDAPWSVRIPRGELQAEFPLVTAPVVATAEVGIVAMLGESRRETVLRLTPRSPAGGEEHQGPREGQEAGAPLSLRFQTPEGPTDHLDLPGGASAGMILVLGEPAPEDLRIVLEVHPEPGLLRIPGSVVLRRGDHWVEFAVEARPVDRPVDLRLEAHHEGLTATAWLNLVP